MNIDVSSLRPRMMSVAYRMLGSVTDAEDVVQDAFLRLQAAPNVSSPEGFLVRTTTRRCIDQLRASRRRQEYIGPWLPEPVDTRSIPDDLSLAESLTQGFLLMLERLSPDERATFLLRAVFNYEFAEIGETLGKSEVNVRQIFTRAKSRLAQDKPRFQPAIHQADGLAKRFIAACRTGDVSTIEHLFADDVEVLSDGGGKVSAARVVITGPSRAARFLAGVFSKKRRSCEMQLATVNGTPGVVFTADGFVVQVVSLQIDHKIRAVYMMVNPDKLVRWSSANVE